MNNLVSKFLNKHGHEPLAVDRQIISAFVFLNSINVTYNSLILKYIIKETDSDYENFLKFRTFFKKEGKPFLSFEDLIELFEFVISPADKIVNGAVYTKNMMGVRV
jgi:adenine-specific DNA-methyltransferase